MWLRSLVEDALPKNKEINLEGEICSVQKIKNATQERSKKGLQGASEKGMTPWKYILEQHELRINCHHCALYHYVIFFTR